MGKHLLVATLGGAWQIVPELLGFTNPNQVPIYQQGEEFQRRCQAFHQHISQVDEVWLASTSSTITRRGWDQLLEWAQVADLPIAFRLWRLANREDIDSAAASREMADLIYRLVLHGQDAVGAGRLSLCLAGGRKTMSAELQQAGLLFGCRALVHVVDTMGPDARRAMQGLSPGDWARELPVELQACFEPVLIDHDVPGHEAIVMQSQWVERFPLPGRGAVHGDCWGGDAVAVDEGTEFYEHVHRQVRDAATVFANYFTTVSGEGPASTFPMLMRLPVRVIEQLRGQRVASAQADEARDLAWLRRLPKADLHCHLGGVLCASEMIEVAMAIVSAVEAARRQDPRFDHDLRRLNEAVRSEDVEALDGWLGEAGVGRFRRIAARWPELPQPLGVAGVLQAFSGRSDLLDGWIYGACRHEERFRQVGFQRYESFGDLQGSALLQCEATIRATMRVLHRQGVRENLRYLEIRCSPINYTRGGMDALQVVRTIVEELKSWSFPARLIFIASRHRGAESIERTIGLAKRVLADGELNKFFVGFDLAGNEAEMPPSVIRNELRELHEHVMRVTIHAGEDSPDSSARNIWEAVYDLSADRIGHGLTLATEPRLLEKLIERRVAVELCPSSNDQIVGFRDRWFDDDASGRPWYPLSEYHRRGLRVTVNTDNPGISRTSISGEYLKAARMAPEGLTRWQVVQLVRNGFRSAFCDAQLKRAVLEAVEREVFQLLASQAEV